MAESQGAFTYDDPTLAALEAAISSDRFAPYMTAAGHKRRYAIALYLYNARLAKAFLFPLHMAEVTLRNGIDELFVERFGPGWPWDHQLRVRLSPQSLDSLDKAIARAPIGPGELRPLRGQVVATLTFDFWSNLFRPEYHHPFWQTGLQRVLPHLPANEGRPEIQALVKSINHFRNRVAHHEPVVRVDAQATNADIVSLIAKRCATTAAWTRDHSTVSVVVRSRPRSHGLTEPSMSDRCDPRFAVVAPGDSLKETLKLQTEKVLACVCVDAGKPVGVLTARNIAAYLRDGIATDDGVFDLNDHTVADVIAGQSLAGRMRLVGANDPASALRDILGNDGEAAVVVDGTPASTVHGVILRAHRRY